MLLLMVVDMERRKEEPQSIERLKVRSSSRIGRHLSLSPQTFFYSTVSYFRNTILIARTYLTVHIFTPSYSRCASQNWPQKAFALHHCRLQCSARSPIEATGEAT